MKNLLAYHGFTVVKSGFELSLIYYYPCNTFQENPKAYYFEKLIIFLTSGFPLIQKHNTLRCGM